MNIAILGATGHIARSLIPFFSTENDLYLFSRTPGYLQYDYLKEKQFDLILNCIGIGTYSNIKDYSAYFTVNERYDNLCIDYLIRNVKTLYLNFSSGVVTEFDGQIKQDNYYAISKLYTEGKHRSLSHLNIVDIRLYSYFSKFVSLKDDYFMCQVLKHIKEGTELVTTPNEMVRDYIHPKDLSDFIINLEPQNAMFTVGSLEDISKHEILEYFKKEHGLKYKIDPDLNIPCATGHKVDYYPEKIDNQPTCTSLQTLALESQRLLMNSE
jgi:nucleoside-diphosphate-sugar epimerase